MAQQSVRMRGLARFGLFAVLLVSLAGCAAKIPDPTAGTPQPIRSTQIQSFAFDGKGRVRLTTTNPSQVYGEMLTAGGYYRGRASSGTVMWDEYRAASNPEYAKDFLAQGLLTEHTLDFTQQTALRNGLDYELKLTIYTPKPAAQIRSIVTATPLTNGNVQALSNKTVYVVPVVGGGAYSRPQVVQCLEGCG